MAEAEGKNFVQYKEMAKSQQNRGKHSVIKILW